MAELSKTARASMGKQVKEVHEESTEEAIRQIRLERAAGLWPNCSRIDKLLAAYDKLSAETKELAKASTELIEQIIPEAIVPAEIPAQEEDPNHMVDFGHNIAHKEPEGA